MKNVAAILLFLLAGARLLAADYHLFYENGKAGLRDESGQVIIPASFDALGWTDGSFSVVNQITGYRSNGKWGLINLNKQLITKAEYESITSAGGDRVIASRWINSFTKKYGCLDLSGKVTVPFNYDGISIHGLRAIVFIKNGVRYEYGLIDLNDRGILPLRFREIKTIGTLRLAVQNFEKKTALFSEEGVQLTDFDIDSISAFRKGRAIVYQQFKQGLIDREGTIELPADFRQVRVNEDGVPEIKNYDEWKILSRDNVQREKIYATSLQASAQHYVIQLLSKFGIVDQQLKSLVPLQFDELRPFQNQLAVARKGGKYGMIRPNGKEAIPFQFDSLLNQKSFLLAGMRSGGKMGWSVYDTFGVCKTTKVYEHLGWFNGKYFPVANYGFQGGVDRYGKEILSCVYDSLLEHNHTQVAVKFKGQYGILDFNEKWLTLPQPRKLQLVNDQRYIEVHDTIRFLKSFDGETIYFTSNKIAVRENYLEETRPDGAIKKISFEGVELTTFPFIAEATEKVFEESEGYRGIQRDGRFGFIDGKNRLRVANRYEAIGKFNEGLAPVRILGRWGFVNKEDKIIINPSYERVEEFQEGVAVVKRNGKMGIIDNQGEVLLATRYDSIFRAGNMLVIVDRDKKGLADTKGSVLIEPRFDELQLLPNDRVLIKSDRHWGVLTYDGLSIIPPFYDSLVYQPSTQTFLAQQQSPWVAWTKP